MYLKKEKFDINGSSDSQVLGNTTSTITEDNSLSDVFFIVRREKDIFSGELHYYYSSWSKLIGRLQESDAVEFVSNQNDENSIFYIYGTENNTGSFYKLTCQDIDGLYNPLVSLKMDSVIDLKDADQNMETLHAMRENRINSFGEKNENGIINCGNYFTQNVFISN